MFRFRSLIFLLLTVYSFSLVYSEGTSPNEIRFRIAKNNVPFKTETNPYYLSHILESRIFQVLKLDFSPEEIVTLVNFILTHASKENPNQIVIPGYEKNLELVIGFRYIEKAGDTLFLVVTNYNIETESIDTSDLQKQLATICQVKSNRFVYSEDLNSEKKIAEYKESGNLLSLANHYLMDEDPNNDSLVNPILESILADENRNELEKFFAFLTKGQLALIQKNLNLAEEIKSKSLLRIQKIKPEDKEKAEFILKLYSKELEWMKIFENKETDPLKT
ncbi:hypothetical protein EHQ68_03575 [Leptospira congkakensis]|uniref:Uncharacterized protein n=1 Tax=Leptospira congkakensis TaxID=2484932 RepID=A0A4Z1A777_9LEPT|nr:hypothetical protein [Leptospira congkakensis]TGL90522.1 hypothetical protein EHQ69_11335 [Leptospira congkakensis]TGL91529.1 hypothetical protein EHQ68_03575 [Leptospira congkakensis]TGL98582.1 hypothetical protein EHQ70_03160 [Leptospira congkakensis]